MELADKARRRLDAEAFDILEKEDGFRLQLLVEYRSKANRSRRLLVDELRRNDLITKARHQALISELNIEPHLHDSLLLDQTLGEESYEDSVVDVAPVPNVITATTQAPLGARKTLVQGSQIPLDVKNQGSMDDSAASRSDSDHLSVSDASSFTLHPGAGFDGETALIGAPQGRRNTQPDARSITSVSLYPPTSDGVQPYLTQLLNQTEALLAAHTNNEYQSIRIRLIALNFVRLSLQIGTLPYDSDESSRMSQLCQNIAAYFEEKETLLWQSSMLAAMSVQLTSSTQAELGPQLKGTLSIRGGSQAGTMELHRLRIEDGWVTQEPVTLDLANASNDGTARTLSRTISLVEGWYQATYSHNNRCTSWQQHIPAGIASAITLPESLEDKGEYVFIQSGYALLGDASSTQQTMPFDIYAVPSFFLAPKRVTYEEYFRFLGFIKRTQGAQSAKRRLPRTAARGGYRWADLDVSNLDQCEERLGDRFRDPVTGVSFHDARAYCHWLNIERGPGHRIPSEAEWAKAIGGSLGTSWSWGEQWTAEQSLGTSPYGISGGVDRWLEWTSSTAEDARYRIARGVTILNGQPSQNTPERHFLPEEQVSANVTFRVARSED